MLIELMQEQSVESLKEQVIISCLGNIYKDQLDSGEIVSYRSSFKNMSNPEIVSNVFITSLIIENLGKIKKESLANKIINRGLEFIIENKENKYTWRFFGKNSKIVPDLDDIAVILRILKANNANLPYQKYSEEIYSNHLNDNGLFYTWFPEKGESNNIDWVVNSNIYLFLKTNGFNLPVIEAYLNNIILNKFYNKGSLYYHSYYYFFYLLSKSYVLDCSFKLSKEAIIDDILNNYNQLNTNYLALSIITLKNFKYIDLEIIEKMSSLLINKIKLTDNIYSLFRHRTINKYYGSYGFTNSIIIEALC